MSGFPEELRRRFEEIRVLGAGGFGRVFEVRDRAAGARRALKWIPVRDDGRREERELAAATRVEHPNLLRCHEVGRLPGAAFMVLELAEASLAGLLASREKTGRAWEVLKDAFHGVAALHAAGLVHRDLKPENVLVVGGVGKVADLGLVRGEGFETLTRTGEIRGTPAYMAPEQARGERSGPATDVFALGVMAYRILEGRLPYPDERPEHLVVRVARADLRPLARSREVLGPDRAALLEALLAPEPRDRPGDLAAVAAALAGPLRERASAGGAATVVIATSAAAPRPVPTPRRTLDARPRGKVPRVAWAVLGVLALAGVVALLAGAPRPVPPATPRPGPVTEPPRSPLEDALAELSRQFTAAGELVWEWGGAPRRAPEGALPDGVRPVLSRDPGTWEALARALPVLPRVQGLLAARGAPPELTAAERTLLEDLDARFHAEGVMRPFQGLLALRPPGPAPTPEETAALLGELPHEVARHLHDAPPLGPWTAAAVRTYRELLDLRRTGFDAVERARAGEPGASLPADIADFAVGGNRLPLTRDRGTNPVEFPHLYVVNARFRAALAPWLDPGGVTHRFFHEVLEAIRRESATREFLALFMLDGASMLQAFWYVLPLVAPLEAWLPPEADLGAEAYVRCRIEGMRMRAVRSLELDHHASFAELSRLHTRAAEADPGVPDSPRAWARRDVAFGIHAKQLIGYGFPEQAVRFVERYAREFRAGLGERIAHTLTPYLVRLDEEPGAPVPSAALMEEILAWARECAAAPRHPRPEDTAGLVARVERLLVRARARSGR